MNNYDRMMESKVLSLKTWLLISAFISSNYATVSCPEFPETFEKGSDAIITCNVRGEDSIAIYWYKGTKPSSKPILQIKNGKFGGIEYGKGHYDITSTGTMIIKNVRREHTGSYFILVDYENKVDEGRTVELKVIVRPIPSCPHIGSCSTCHYCSLEVSENASLTCKMNGIQPPMPIKWIILDKQDVNITVHPQTLDYNTNTDTWNVSTKLSYTALSCNNSVSLQCVTEDEWNVLEYHSASASLKIEKDGCSKEPTLPSNFLVLIAFILIVCLVIGFNFWKKPEGIWSQESIFWLPQKWLNKLIDVFREIFNRFLEKVTGIWSQESMLWLPQKWLNKLIDVFREILNRFSKKVAGIWSQESILWLPQKWLNKLIEIFLEIPNRCFKKVAGIWSQESILWLPQKWLNKLIDVFRELLNRFLKKIAGVWSPESILWLPHKWLNKLIDVFREIPNRFLKKVAGVWSEESILWLPQRWLNKLIDVFREIPNRFLKKVSGVWSEESILWLPRRWLNKLIDVFREIPNRISKKVAGLLAKEKKMPTKRIVMEGRTLIASSDDEEEEICTPSTELPKLPKQIIMKRKTLKASSDDKGKENTLFRRSSQLTERSIMIRKPLNAFSDDEDEENTPYIISSKEKSQSSNTKSSTKNNSSAQQPTTKPTRRQRRGKSQT